MKPASTPSDRLLNAVAAAMAPALILSVLYDGLWPAWGWTIIAAAAAIGAIFGPKQRP